MRNLLIVALVAAVMGASVACSKSEDSQPQGQGFKTTEVEGLDGATKEAQEKADELQKKADEEAEKLKDQAEEAQKKAEEEANKAAEEAEKAAEGIKGSLGSLGGGN